MILSLFQYIKMSPFASRGRLPTANGKEILYTSLFQSAETTLSLAIGSMQILLKASAASYDLLRYSRLQI